MTRSEDFKRVQRTGRSYAHPLLVLYYLLTDDPGIHVGVTAGLAVGNAVMRNRAKRLIRAAMNELLPKIRSGSQLLIIARPSLPGATFLQTHEALAALMERAGLFFQA
jgi:ribonuclease P protein component